MEEGEGLVSRLYINLVVIAPYLLRTRPIGSSGVHREVWCGGAAPRMAALHSVEPYLLQDRVVSDEEVAVVAQNHLEKWEDLSPFLKLTSVDEQAIRNTNSDYKEQKRALFREWKRQNGSEATYRVLIAAAKEARNKKLADNLEEMLRLTELTDRK